MHVCSFPKCYYSYSTGTILCFVSKHCGAANALPSRGFCQHILVRPAHTALVSPPAPLLRGLSSMAALTRLTGLDLPTLPVVITVEPPRLVLLPLPDILYAPALLRSSRHGVGATTAYRDAVWGIAAHHLRAGIVERAPPYLVLIPLYSCRSCAYAGWHMRAQRRFRFTRTCLCVATIPAFCVCAT